MFYVKIPLRYLAPASEQKGGVGSFSYKVGSILYDLRKGNLPSWAISHEDLQRAVIHEEPDEPTMVNEDGVLCPKCQHPMVKGRWAPVCTECGYGFNMPEKDFKMGRVNHRLPGIPLLSMEGKEINQRDALQVGIPVKVAGLVHDYISPIVSIDGNHAKAESLHAMIEYYESPKWNGWLNTGFDDGKPIVEVKP